MSLATLLNDERFNLFFSLILGIGIICMIRPMCAGSECMTLKPPAEKDFDQYVYRVAGGKCYEFKSELVECPTDGAIEAFQQPLSQASFSHRPTPIQSA